MSERTALYRHFDAHGSLLYVGISNDVLRRLCQHQDRSHWAAQIARVDIEHHPSRTAALTAEAMAIEREAPRWNRHLPIAPRRGNFAIEHAASGMRDGNYFDAIDADEMLAHWSREYPGESFRLITADPATPGGATAFRPALRPWSMEAHIGAAA